jgi:hypothetical protein
MIIRTRQIAFAGASFGARSYTTPQRECSVGDYDGRPNGWQGWCDCMFAQDEALRLKCRKRPCANPFDTDRDCVFGVVNPALSFAPWTEAGAGIRGIPKEGGGLLYLFGSGFRPIDAFELEPDYFFKLTCLDPLRAAYIVGHYEEGFANAARAGYKFTFDPAALRAMYFVLSAQMGVAVVTQNVPLVGGIFTAQAAVVFFGTGGTAVWPILLPVAIPYALARDPSGERLNNLVFTPAASVLGDILGLVSSALGLVGGDPAAVAGIIRVLCNRAGNMLPADSAAQDVKIARALLFAAAKISPQIANLIRDPEGTLQTETLYMAFGDAVANVAKELKGKIDDGVYSALIDTGNFFRQFSPSLSVVAQATVTGNGALLCCGPDTAFDLIPLKVPGLGFKISALVQIAQDVAKAGQGTATQIQALVYNGPEAQKGLQNIQKLFRSIEVFARELNKALVAFGPVGKFFDQTISRLLTQKAEFDKLVVSTQQQVAAGTRPAQAVLNTAAQQKLITTGGRVFVPDPAMPLPPNLLRLPGGGGGGGPTLPIITAPGASSGGGLAPILAGAGAGFLVGGPIGALVGAGALALASKK